MPFTRGMQRPAGAGRKKGTGDRATVTRILETFRCDPIEGMIRIAQDKDSKPELRARMYAELAQYRWPKLRAMELSGPDGGAIETKDVSATELLTRRIDSLSSRIGKS